MSSQVKHRREAAAFLSGFVGAQAELLVDTTNNRLQVHDGVTPGGWPVAKLGEVQNAAGIINAADYIAKAGGANDVAVQLAIGAAVAAGVSVVRMPNLAGGGVWTFRNTVVNPGLSIIGDPFGTKIVRVGQGSAFRAGAVPAAVPAVSACTLIPGGLVPNTLSITLPSGAGATYAAGQDYLILSEDVIRTRTTCLTAEFTKIMSVSGDTITVCAPVKYPYTAANKARLFPFAFLENVVFDNLLVQMDPTVVPSNGLTAFVNFAFELKCCRNPNVNRCGVTNNPAPAVHLVWCLNAKITHCAFADLGSADQDAASFGGGATRADGGLGGFGYAVCETGPNEGLLYLYCTVERCRHAYTTTDGYPAVCQYGETVAPFIGFVRHRQAKEAGFDTHAAGMDVTFYECSIIGGHRCGFQIRSFRCKVINCIVVGVWGAAVWIYGASANNGACGDECVVRGLSSSNTNFGFGDPGDSNTDWRTIGAIRDQGFNSVVQDIKISGCAGPAGSTQSGAIGGLYRHWEVYSPCQAAAAVAALYGTGVYACGFLFTHSNDNPRIKGFMLKSPDGLCVDLVRANQATLSPIIDDIDGIGHTGITYTNSAGGLASITGGPRRHARSAGKRNVVTIASNTVSLAGLVGSKLTLVPSGGTGTTDTLTTITGAEEDDIIEVSVDAAGSMVTLSNGNGLNQLRLKGGVNATLTGVNARIQFGYQSGAFIENWRNF